MTAYKHYQIDETSVGFIVRDPRFSRTMFVADNMAEARRWVNAYREGRIWAVQAVQAVPA